MILWVKWMKILIYYKLSYDYGNLVTSLSLMLMQLSRQITRKNIVGIIHIFNLFQNMTSMYQFYENLRQVGSSTNKLVEISAVFMTPTNFTRKETKNGPYRKILQPAK